MTATELKSRREALKLSQSQIAASLETPLSTYLKWEQGARRVPGIVNVALMYLEHNAAHKPKKDAA